ncbi:MAG: prepilin-type N-terminal cleavage/methylation domain-containing protein [Kiritimatiellia bacterium]|nr:prepilin-type N-terminal cleavage/methylation domain-containing protein [Kiritimatiellia bacterium]
MHDDHESKAQAGLRRDGLSARRGFTFLETIAAMAILGLALTGFYRVLIQSARTRQAAHHHYVAVIIANNRIERAKNLRFEDLPLLAESQVAVDQLGSPDTAGTFLRSTVVAPNQGGDPRVTRLTVTVRAPSMRRDGSGTRPSESVSTLLTEYLVP